MSTSTSVMETQNLSIPVVFPPEILHCLRCMERLKTSLLHIKGVQAAEVDTDGSSILLTYDPSMVSMDRIERIAQRAGIHLNEEYRHETFILSGLHCLNCANDLEKAITDLPGVIWVALNFGASKILVEYEPQQIQPKQIIQLVKKLGFNAMVEKRQEAPKEKGYLLRHREAAITALSGVLLISGGICNALSDKLIGNIFYIAAMLICGYPTLRSGILALRAKRMNTNLLMGVAGVGAAILGDYLEGALVLFLYSLGEALEDFTVEKTRKSIRSLADIFPAEAKIRRNGQEFNVPLDRIHVGDIMIVRPGERIAMDGKVISGISSLDQSPITGESIPVSKGVGDEIYAGSINQRGTLEVKVTRDSRDNAIARIINLVEKAQAQKAPTQRYTEKFGDYYTPAVISLAVLVAAVPPIFFGVNPHTSIYRALTLLVISCPCALVLSAPIAIISAISHAAKRGVLIKGGAYLEEMAKISVMAFDKTGTLTRGKPHVTDIITVNGATEEEVLSAAAALEARSEHPLASAILREAAEKNIGYETPQDFISLPGRGVQGKLGNKIHILGNLRILDKKNGSCMEAEGLLSDLHKQGKTGIILCREDHLLGVIAVADEIRGGMKSVIEQLRKSGIRHIELLTGDQQYAAKAVSDQLGLDGYRAELLPENKVDYVRQLSGNYGKIAMVGDGINDAPALARASIGIAMGAAGSDQALESADIALMADDLTQLPFAFRLSTLTLRTIKFNVALAIGTVLLLVAGALLGYVSLYIGVLGHEGSALLVIANGMRLLKARP